MTLEQYLVESGKDYATAAKELEISKAYVGQLVHRKSTPGLRLAKRIWLWSDKKISMDGWLE